MKVRSQQQTADRRETIDRGFTLIEIIVVITIIAILTSLGLMVGNKVRVNSQAQATKSLVISLDQAYTSYSSDRDPKLPSVFRDDDGNEFPIFDGRVNPVGADPTSDLTEPSLALLVLATGDSSPFAETIRRADSRYLTNAYVLKDTPALSLPTPPCPDLNTKNSDGSQRYYVRTAMPKAPQKSGALDLPCESQLQPQFAGHRSFRAPYLKDAWGNPIRFVHPRFDGGFGNFFGSSSMQTRASSPTSFKFNGAPSMFTLRRSYRPFDPTTGGSASGDSDEGLCIGGRGYFYSSGPDKDPGTRDDNVYLDGPPKFPSETANLH